MPTAIEMLKELAKRCPPSASHPWAEYADLVRECGIVSANAYGFTVECGDGDRSVEFPGGLTAEHYRYFGPLLSDFDKGILVKGVVQNLLPTMCWIDGTTVWWLMQQEHGEYEEEWLPEMVESLGFDAIASAMAVRLTKYRKTHRVPRIKWVQANVPAWKGGVLYFGQHTWTIRRQPGPLNDLLDAFENCRWEHSAQMPQHLVYEQVSDAVKGLRGRTRPFIGWKVAADGLVSWFPK